MSDFRERPILFSAPMVRAILDGRKTQTRRAAKLTVSGHVKELGGHRRWHPGDSDGRLACPYGQPSDRLWVRETWQHSNHPFGPLENNCTIFFRADYFDDPHGMDGEKSPEGKYRDWRPSIHMLRWASRITLEITGVRVERLNQISDADCWAEAPPGLAFPVRSPSDYACTEGGPQRAFRRLWHLINGDGSWDANPWVWVVEFSRVPQAEGGR